MTIDENFRQNINLNGLSWTDSICYPVRFLSFLRADEELEAKDKLILLRLYDYLQYMDPDVEPLIEELCQKLTCLQWIDCEPCSENSDSSEVAAAPETKIGKPKIETLLLPLFNHLYPEIKDRMYGYRLFIQGELMGFVFPRNLMILIKYMEVSDAQRKKKNVTGNFILNFLFQLVFRDKKFIADDYFVAGRQLNTNQENLLFALSKTCFEHHELGVDVTDGKALAEIIETDTTINNDDNSYEQATRLFYNLKYGESGENQLTDKAIHSWETQWKHLAATYNITITEIITLLPKLFSERKAEYVPTIFARKENDPGNSLGSLLVMMRNRKLEKKTKKYNVLNILGS